MEDIENLFDKAVAEIERMLNTKTVVGEGIVKLTIFDPRKQSTVSSLKLSSRELGARHRLPFTECPRTKLAIVNRSRQMPAQSEQIPCYAIYCKKALSLFG